MSETTETYHFAWVVLALLACTFFLFAIYTQRQSKNLFINVDKKKQALADNPVEEIIQNLQRESDDIENKIERGQPIYLKLKDELALKKEQLKYIDVGLYPPTFKFDDSQSLKNKIAEYIERQYQVIKSGRATSAFSNWEWFGSKSKGTQMITSYQGLLLKAFNAEFDMIRRVMRHSSYDTAINKLSRLEQQLAKLGETANVTISNEYFNLKVEELTIWHQELLHKEDLKEEQRQELQIQREAEREEKRIKAAAEKTEKERLIMERLVAEELSKLEYSTEEQKALYEVHKQELEKLREKAKRAISLAQQTRAGYVYVISNKLSFGEGVVKIGMTRRADPYDRVKELGDASVPELFDVHAFAFTEDAPTFERFLHSRFSDQRVNLINGRKEFFFASADDVVAEMKNYEGEYELNEIAVSISAS